MEVFWIILALIFVVAIAMAGIIVPLVITATDDDERFTVLQKIGFHVGGAVLTAATIATAVALSPPVNNSHHCGTGTTYQESSHYDTATKTTQTDWWCARG